MLIYGIYALILLIFLALTWYAIHRVFSVPHPYEEARIVTFVLIVMLALVLIWSVKLFLSINWESLL